MQTDIELLLVMLVAAFLVIYFIIPLIVHMTSLHERIVTCPETETWRKLS